MSKDWTKDLPEAAANYLLDRKLDEIECIVADLPGIARGKAVPASKFARQEFFHLPDSIFFQTITGDWGEAAGDEGFIEKDMILRPDMSTATRWRSRIWSKSDELSRKVCSVQLPDSQ